MDRAVSRYVFDTPLVEGVIVARKHRFALSVLVDGEVHDGHCPTTGSIGGISLNERPCLLSVSRDASRKTPFTVEAISLDPATKRKKSWIGINQNAANRYVEHALAAGQLRGMVRRPKSIKREQVLGVSKLDFLVDDVYIEVKTPLAVFNVDIPSEIVLLKKPASASVDRFLRHIQELAGYLDENKKAVLLVCFLYESRHFVPPGGHARSAEVRKIVQASIERGVRVWQANFAIDPIGVSLSRHFEITQDFL